MVENGAGVGVVAGEFLGGLPLIASVRPGLVIGEHGSSGFELVINLGDGDDVSVTGEHRGDSVNGSGDLKDLTVEDDAGIFARRDGPEDVGPHRPVSSRKFYLFVVEDDHRLGF